MVIGVTGGTASGQSTVSQYLEEKGAFVISADKEAKALVDNNPTILSKLVESFGEEILDREGKLNRKKLGNIVFPNPNKLEKLNSIVHPPLLLVLKERIEKAKERYRFIILDAALIVEADIRDWCEVLIVVTAEEDRRKRRLMERDNLSEEIAKARMDSQLSLEAKKEFAHYVVTNNGTFEETRQQIEEIWQDILENKSEFDT